MSKKSLQDLHTLVAETLAKEIKDGEASASVLSVAVKFLKDNGIEALPDKSKAVQSLAEALPALDDVDFEAQGLNPN